ncbi:hypothetical protein llap_12131 [Limosa lapponica baueri]|uniref:Uncharacterized protein n=1 Tax=Limosa lapponica baueri TaxID=1758121 RepID=A0A2I0TV21_LIMLA|nr:hypothetical protein llap_12131 [Limosa lapponica baueri]
MHSNQTHSIDPGALSPIPKASTGSPCGTAYISKELLLATFNLTWLRLTSTPKLQVVSLDLLSGLPVPLVKTMDGDSSTTDASQLGIAGDYIGGSHYVIQPHDDTEDSMNDHEDTNGSKESFREQDIYLPIANVSRIMKNAIPQTGKVSWDIECWRFLFSVVRLVNFTPFTSVQLSNQLPAGLITTDGQQQNVMVYTTSYQQVLSLVFNKFSSHDLKKTLDLGT